MWQLRWFGWDIQSCKSDAIPSRIQIKNHNRGKLIPTVLDTIRDKGDTIRLDDIVFRGDDGVLCVEAGGPTPGVGCADAVLSLHLKSWPS